MRLVLMVFIFQWWSVGYACSPYHWSAGGGAKTSREYAQLLLQNASAIVHARVTLAAKVQLHSPVHSQIEMSAVDVRGYAQLEVLERFKGPNNLRVIFTSVKMGNCSNPAFIEGEERMFVLNSYRDDKYFEVIAWQTPKFPQDELVAQMRLLSRSNFQVERDSPQAARPSPKR